jgi:hypothetical protein
MDDKTRRVEDALRKLGSEHEPRPDWQDRVWKRIARLKAPWWVRLWRWLLR